MGKHTPITNQLPCTMVAENFIPMAEIFTTLRKYSLISFDAYVLTPLRVRMLNLGRQMKALLVYFRGYVKDSILGPVLN